MNCIPGHKGGLRTSDNSKYKFSFEICRRDPQGTKTQFFRLGLNLYFKLVLPRVCADDYPTPLEPATEKKSLWSSPFAAGLRPEQYRCAGLSPKTAAGYLPKSS